MSVAPIASVPPTWTLCPFAGYLLVLAAAPLCLGRLWQKHRTKLGVALGFSAPVAVYLLASHGAPLLWDSLSEYAAFLALLGALFVISGGIILRGSLRGSPLGNTALLGLGAVAANLIGTTGASVLLIRPLLRANEGRSRKTHLVVFFIFIVSNSGGMLTPLGDPPLFLGFLRGVPFLWTLSLAGPWAFVNGLLLLIFAGIDRTLRRRELPALPPEGPREAGPSPGGWIEGGLNLLWLAGIVALNLLVGYFAQANRWGDDLRRYLLVAGLVLLGGLSWLTTPRQVRVANGFGWGPIGEVAVVFLGIFVTMVPALELLKEWGLSGRIRLERPWEFFWASGALSSVLDNTPTYLTFASLASGVVGGHHPGGLDPSRLDSLLAYPEGVRYLTAISSGSVLMGAMTYIGNGPNIMVKAIAEEARVPMPGFLGYLAWSVPILLPLFLGVTVLFLRY